MPAKNTGGQHMTQQRYGAELSSQDRWQHIGPQYASNIDGPYHRHRLDVIDTLIPRFEFVHTKVIDFGCGEGALIRLCKRDAVSNIVGIDPDQHLLDLAKTSGADELICGGVEALEKQPAESVHGLIAANVLGYMSGDDEQRFYAAAKRILHPRGWMIVVHSNELFDLFTLNSFTREFFLRHFGVDVASLLTNPEEPKRPSYSIRENPLAYPYKLRRLGFQVERTEYINMHPIPPLLTGLDYSNVYNMKDRTFPNTLTVSPAEKWKLMLQCSMFGVRAVLD
jgi:2-polyprenyl-3-methyl-5-hydroxy-6-metoxy-1,4-benzoquinol methylase